MAEVFDKRLKYLGNDAYICGKWFKYLRNGQNIQEMAVDHISKPFPKYLIQFPNL